MTTDGASASDIAADVCPHEADHVNRADAHPFSTPPVAGEHHLSRERPPGAALNPLAYLTSADLQVLSAVAGRTVVAGSPIVPLLAAQIGLDRRSSALPMAEQLSISYFKSLASHHRAVGALSVGLLREIDLAVAFLAASRDSATVSASDSRVAARQHRDVADEPGRAVQRFRPRIVGSLR